MFCIYADGELLYYPPSDEYMVQSPKLTMEMGKAGSLTFGLLPSNAFYGQLRKLKTLITVEYDGEEIFRGRVLSEERSFNNTISYYCEGDLSYLVDSVQSNDAYEGKVHDLFAQMIQNHNAMVEPSKQFLVGEINVENRDVLISGVSEDIENAETGGFNYRQIAINATTSDWETTFDRINSTIIEYTGGYLRTRRGQGGVYVDLLTDYGSQTAQAIEFGVNLLDLTEEISAEDLFTVLIPLGDENLTIASVNGGSVELVDQEAVALYGRIVRTNVFSGVTDAATLMENGQRYLANNVNVPVTITVKAVDMHIVDPNTDDIHVGDRVYVNSQPHSIVDTLVCTKIDYDLENAANNEYTFGNPVQTLTQRYRKSMKQVEENAEDAAESAVGGGSGGGGGGGGGGAAEAAAEQAKKDVYNAWIDLDPEHAKISLGALSKLYDDMKGSIERQVGINLDGAAGTIVSKTMKAVLDEAGQEISTQSTRIAQLETEYGAKIEMIAAYMGVDKDKDGNWAKINLEAGSMGSYIESEVSSKNKTYNSRLIQLENGFWGTAQDPDSGVVAKVTANTNEIALRLTQNDLESYVSLISGIVTIGGQRVNLNGIVHAEDLEAVKATINNLTAGRTKATYISTSKLSVDGELRVKSINFGNNESVGLHQIKTNLGGLGGQYMGTGDVDIKHSHSIKFTVSDDGRVEVEIGNEQKEKGTNFFNIADTQFFKDRISAASLDVNRIRLTTEEFSGTTLPLKITAYNENNEAAGSKNEQLSTSFLYDGTNDNGYTYNFIVGGRTRSVSAQQAYTNGTNNVTITKIERVGEDEINFPYVVVHTRATASNGKTRDQDFYGNGALLYQQGQESIKVFRIEQTKAPTLSGTTYTIFLKATATNMETLETEINLDASAVAEGVTIPTFTSARATAKAFSGSTLPVDVTAYDGSGNSMGTKTVNLSTNFIFDSSDPGGYKYNFIVGGQSRSVSATQAYNNGMSKVMVSSIEQTADPTLSGNTYTLYLRGTASNKAYKDFTITLDASEVMNNVTVPTFSSVNVSAGAFSGTTLPLTVTAYDDSNRSMGSKTANLSTNFVFNSSNSNGYTYNFVVGGQSRSVSAQQAYNNGVSSVTVAKVEQVSAPTLSGTTYTLYLRGTASNEAYKDQTITLDASAVADAVIIPTLSSVNVTAGAFSGTTLPLTIAAYDENGGSMGSKTANLSTNFVYNSSNTNGYTYNLVVGGQTRSVSAQQAYLNGSKSVTVAKVEQVSAPTLSGTTYTLYLRGTASNEAYKDQTITLDASAVAAGVTIPTFSSVNVTAGAFSGTTLPLTIAAYDENGSSMGSKTANLSTNFVYNSGNANGYTYNFVVGGQTRSVSAQQAYNNGVDSVTVYSVSQVSAPTLSGTTYTLYLRGTASNGKYKDETITLDASAVAESVTIPTLSSLNVTAGSFVGTDLSVTATAYDESGNSIGSGQASLPTNFTYNSSITNGYTYNFTVGGQTRTVSAQQAYNNGVDSVTVHSISQVAAPTLSGTTYTLYLRGTASNEAYKDQTITLDAKAVADAVQITGAMISAVTLTIGDFSGTSLPTVLRVVTSDGRVIKEINGSIATDFQKGSGDNQYIFTVGGHSRTVTVEGTSSGSIDGSMIQTVNATPISYNAETLTLRLSVVSSEGAVVKEVQKDIDLSFMGGGSGGSGTVSNVSYIQATTDGFDGDALLLVLQGKTESGTVVTTSPGRLATSLTKVSGTTNQYTLKIGGATRTVTLDTSGSSGGSGGESSPSISYIQATTNGFDGETLLLNLQGKSESGTVIMSSAGRLATSITKVTGSTNQYTLKIGGATRVFTVDSSGSSVSVSSVGLTNSSFSGTTLVLNVAAKDASGNNLKTGSINIATSVTQVSGNTYKLTCGNVSRTFTASWGSGSSTSGISSISITNASFSGQTLLLTLSAKNSSGTSLGTGTTTVYTNLQHQSGATYLLQCGTASRSVTCQKAYDAGYDKGYKVGYREGKSAGGSKGTKE